MHYLNHGAPPNNRVHQRCFLSTLQCYTPMTSMKPVTFKYANEDCQSVRGTLITISDQVEQGGSCSSIGFDLPECALVTWKLCLFFFVFFLSSYKITNHRAFVFQTSSRPSCQEWQTWTEYGSAWKSISETWSGSISLQLNMSTLTRCL